MLSLVKNYFPTGSGILILHRVKMCPFSPDRGVAIRDFQKKQRNKKVDILEVYKVAVNLASMGGSY